MKSKTRNFIKRQAISTSVAVSTAQITAGWSLIASTSYFGYDFYQTFIKNDETLKKLQYKYNPTGSIYPEMLDYGVPSYSYLRYPRPSIRFPDYLYRMNRDFRVLNSIWHGDENRKWGIKTAVITQAMHDEGVSATSERLGGESVNVWYDGDSADDKPKNTFKYGHIECSVFNGDSEISDTYWTRTLITVKMPPKPDDFDELISAYIVFEPMTVFIDWAAEETQTVNFLALVGGYTFNEYYGDWDESKPGEMWDLPGAYKYNQNFSIVDGEKFVANFRLVPPDDTLYRYGLTSAKYVAPRLHFPRSYYILPDPLRTPLGLGKIRFNISDVQWGSESQYLLMWKKEMDAGSETTPDKPGQENLESTSDSSELTLVSTYTKYDYDHWDLSSSEITDVDQIGGILEWLSFPTLRKPHLVIQYKKKSVDSNKNDKVIVPELSTELGNDKGDPFVVYSRFMRSVPENVSPIEAIDYIRSSPIPDTFDIFKIDITSSNKYGYVSNDGIRTYLKPRLTFDDSCLRQTELGAELVGCPASLSYDSVSGTRYYGSRLGIIPLGLNEDNGSYTIKILGEWYDKDGNLYNNGLSVGTATLSSSGGDAHQVSVVSGPASGYDFCWKIHAVNIPNDPLTAHYAIVPLIEYNNTWKFNQGELSDDEWYILGCSDKNFFTLQSGEPIVFALNNGISWLNYNYGRVVAITDFVPGNIVTPSSYYFITIGKLDQNNTFPIGGEIDLYAAPLGNSLIYVIPPYVKGTIMVRKEGSGDGIIAGFGDIDTDFANPPRFISVPPDFYYNYGVFGHEYAAVFNETDMGYGYDVYSPLPVTKPESVSFKDEDENDLTIPLDPGQEFYIHVRVENGTPLPDEVRVEWLRDDGIERLESATLNPVNTYENIVVVGPLSFTALRSNYISSSSTLLRVYTSVGNGPDTMLEVPITDFYIRQRDDLASVEGAIFPTNPVAGDILYLRASNLSYPHSNIKYPTPTAGFGLPVGWPGKRYVWKIYLQSDLVTPVDTIETDDNITTYTVPSGYAGEGLHITLDVYLAYHTLSGGSDYYETTELMNVFETDIDVISADDATTVYGYKFLGVPDLKSGISSYNFGIERDISTTVADDNSILFSDNGLNPKSVNVSGSVSGRWAGDDLEYLRNIVLNGENVYWEAVEGTVCGEKRFRYLGKAKSLTENKDTSGKVDWSLTVEGVRRVEL